MKNKEAICDYCGGMFLQTRKNKLFCCTNHRIYFNRNKIKNDHKFRQDAQEIFLATLNGIRVILNKATISNMEQTLESAISMISVATATVKENQNKLKPSPVKRKRNDKA